MGGRWTGRRDARLSTPDELSATLRAEHARMLPGLHGIAVRANLAAVLASLGSSVGRAPGS